MQGKRFAAALLGMGLLLGMPTTSAQAQSALEMSISCRVIAYAPRAADGSVNFPLSFETGNCWGGIGALQQAVRYNDDSGRPMLDVCPPPDSTLTGMASLFVRYVDTHPEEIGEHWFRIAYRSLLEAYPCPKTPPG